MSQTLYLLYVLSFVVGSIAGLVLSYKKYKAPFVTQNVDVLALVLAVVGWVLALNSPLFGMIPSYISITVGIFLIAMVLGMRPGYGRYETVTGFAVAAVLWILRTVIL
jgi:energy-converting hydrogenase A subunit L